MTFPFFFLRIWTVKLGLQFALRRSVIVPLGIPFSHGLSMAGTSDRLNFSEAGLTGFETQIGGDRAEWGGTDGVG